MGITKFEEYSSKNRLSCSGKKCRMRAATFGSLTFETFSPLTPAKPYLISLVLTDSGVGGARSNDGGSVSRRRQSSALHPLGGGK